jgi:hypothetical protein
MGTYLRVIFCVFLSFLLFGWFIPYAMSSASSAMNFLAFLSLVLYIPVMCNMTGLNSYLRKKESKDGDAGRTS